MSLRIKVIAYVFSVLTVVLAAGSWVSYETKMSALSAAYDRLLAHEKDGVETTIPLHQRLIGETDFIHGDYNIHWLEKMLSGRKT